MQDELKFWLILWIGVASLIVGVRLRRKISGCGLLFAYLGYLWTIHWGASAIYLIPWYSYYDLRLVLSGLQESAFAVMGLAGGSMILGPLLVRAFGSPKSLSEILKPDPLLPKAYVALGLVCYFLLGPTLGGVATLSALISSGWNLMIVGFSLMLWRSWHEKKGKGFLMAFALSLLGLPLLTIVMQGFLSYGSAAFMTIFAFVASFFRPRWKLILLSLFIGYLGLSFYLTYMRDRDLIREVVWGERPFRERIAQVSTTFSSFEWFHLSNESQLRRIDDRLNQNWLLGTAVHELRHTEEYARGKTLWEAVIALVPRALWPEKPVRAGSGDIVSRFTGIPFAEGTSVGVGQVMEFYINFGRACVVIGFVLLGALITWFDAGASQCLRRGDWQGFTFWFLPGISLLQAGGSLVEVTASMAASMVLCLFVNRIILPRLAGKRLFRLPSFRVL